MSLLSLFHPLGRRHATAGRVWCPLANADVDIERCFACGHLRRAGSDEQGTFIECRPIDLHYSTEHPIVPLGR